MSRAMPDSRRHRGPHPRDAELFGDKYLPTLCTAVAELSWLLERGYSETAALTLVSDHHQLRTRQRKAVRHCACGDSALATRASSRREIAAARGRSVAIDGFNCIIGLEAALAGGAILVGRDGCHRDMSSVHGSYRRVEETAVAIATVAELLAQAVPSSTTWYLDRPVSNSGRLKQQLEAEAARRALDWSVELVNNPDRCLVELADTVVASGDSWVIDRCREWTDLPNAATRNLQSPVWLVNLGDNSRISRPRD
jgi:hypothetical protein